MNDEIINHLRVWRQEIADELTGAIAQLAELDAAIPVAVAAEIASAENFRRLCAAVLKGASERIGLSFALARRIEETRPSPVNPSSAHLRAQADIAAERIDDLKQAVRELDRVLTPPAPQIVHSSAEPEDDVHFSDVIVMPARSAAE